jgi:hypothetical protein
MQAVVAWNLPGVSEETQEKKKLTAVSPRFEQSTSRALPLCQSVEFEVPMAVGSNAVSFGESSTFWRSIPPPSSGWKSKPSKKPKEAGGKLNSDFLLGLLVHPEDGGGVTPERWDLS